jgi:hypothetical protein
MKLVVVSLAAVGLHGCAMNDATADDPATMDPETVMAAQAPLVEVATRIQNLPEAAAGLGGIELDVAQGRVAVWWKGPVPASLRDEIARAGVRVDVGESAYAQTELIAAARRIASQHDAYPGMHAVGPRPDGGGLDIAVDDAIEPAARGYTFDDVAGGIPVDVVVKPAFAPTSRNADSPPFWAGGRAFDPLTGNMCSTGFAVHRTFLWFETSRGILTAEHCHIGGNVNFFTGAGLLIGKADPAPAFNSSSGFNHTDSLYINASSDPRMWDGPVGAGEFTKGVVGETSSFVGLFVCQSGATGGTHCNTRVNQINTNVFLFPSGMLVENASLATEQSGGVAVVGGDSGGAVFTLSGASNVNATGIINGGAFPVTCPAGLSSCFNELIFEPIGNVLINQNASLVTL